MNRSSSIWWGIVLIVIGGLLLLDNVYDVDFGEIIHTYWPVLLIIWGLSVLGRRTVSHSAPPSPSMKVDGATATMYPSSDENRLSVSTVFGDYTVAIHSKSFVGGKVSTTFGNIDIDFLNAQLADGEHSLALDGVFGNTTLHLPKGIAFAVYASTTFGGVRMGDQRKEGISSSLDFTSPDFQTAKSRLRISLSRVFGDITVAAE